MSRFAVVLTVIACAAARADDAPPSFGGRYPHLTVSNSSGECGIGAVVPWAGRLWLVTYAPHARRGSDDKLYEVDAGCGSRRGRRAWGERRRRGSSTMPRGSS